MGASVAKGAVLLRFALLHDCDGTLSMEFVGQFFVHGNLLENAVHDRRMFQEYPSSKKGVSREGFVIKMKKHPMRMHGVLLGSSSWLGSESVTEAHSGKDENGGDHQQEDQQTAQADAETISVTKSSAHGIQLLSVLS
jgi:hypothetical protein